MAFIAKDPGDDVSKVAILQSLRLISMVTLCPSSSASCSNPRQVGYIRWHILASALWKYGNGHLAAGVHTKQRYGHRSVPLLILQLLSFIHRFNSILVSSYISAAFALMISMVLFISAILFAAFSMLESRYNLYW